MNENAGQEEPIARPSTIVNRDDLPGVQAREEINELLRAHDSDVAEANLARLTHRHSPLLRQIARDPEVSGRDPNLRRNAITALGRIVSVENLNLLTELATRDDDELVRSSALIALARTGLQLAVPLLAGAQNSKYLVEANAASKGLAALADRLGPQATRADLRFRQRPVPGEGAGGETAPDSD